MAAGQKVSITLIDYGWGTVTGDTRCQPYAYVGEKTVGVNQTVCGNGERQRHVYTSTSNHVLVQIVPGRARETQFLIRFEGTCMLQI